jgi:hypothetical protein
MYKQWQEEVMWRERIKSHLARKEAMDESLVLASSRILLLQDTYREHNKELRRATVQAFKAP